MKRPPIRYFGGKWMVRKVIHSYMTGHHTIFFSWMLGGGSVEMSKKRVETEVFNDRWGLITNVFKVLRDKKQSIELKRLLELTPYSRDEWEYTDSIDVTKITDELELARITLFRAYSGFSSASVNADISTGFRRYSGSARCGPATDWKNYPKHIESFTSRLQGVCIENKHYKEICYIYDSENTLHRPSLRAWHKEYEQ